jgi:hypothetical protein
MCDDLLHDVILEKLESDLQLLAESPHGSDEILVHDFV